MFATLTDAERLNRPSFERLDAGISSLVRRRGEPDTMPRRSSRSACQSRPHRRYRPPAGVPMVTLAAVQGRAGVSAVRTTAGKVTVREDAFVVRDGGGAIVNPASSASEAYARARASGGVAVHEDDVVEIGAL
jgi:hypothetical protein